MKKLSQFFILFCLKIIFEWNSAWLQTVLMIIRSELEVEMISRRSQVFWLMRQILDLLASRVSNATEGFVAGCVWLQSNIVAFAYEAGMTVTNSCFIALTHLIDQTYDSAIILCTDGNYKSECEDGKNGCEFHDEFGFAARKRFM